MKSILTAIVILLITAVTSFAADVPLEWDENPSPYVVGYNLYFGTESGVYGTPVPVVDGTTVTIPDLLDGGKYYFAVSAYSETTESPQSEEISYTVPLEAPGGLKVKININVEVTVTTIGD